MLDRVYAPGNGIVDPIERRPVILTADVKVSEVNDAFQQLADFLPPSKSPLPVSLILTKIREYIKSVIMTGFDVSLTFLLFRIQVRCTPGHGIEIFIKQLLVNEDKTKTHELEIPDYTHIYSGEWR